jgi:hypothetical protein
MCAPQRVRGGSPMMSGTGGMVCGGAECAMLSSGNSLPLRSFGHVRRGVPLKQDAALRLFCEPLRAVSCGLGFHILCPGLFPSLWGL